MVVFSFVGICQADDSTDRGILQPYTDKKDTSKKRINKFIQQNEKADLQRVKREKVGFSNRISASKSLRTRDAKSAFCGRSRLAIHPPELPEESGGSGDFAFPAAVIYASFTLWSPL
jgi:hypothetical protein